MIEYSNLIFHQINLFVGQIELQNQQFVDFCADWGLFRRFRQRMGRYSGQPGITTTFEAFSVPFPVLFGLKSTQKDNSDKSWSQSEPSLHKFPNWILKPIGDDFPRVSSMHPDDRSRSDQSWFNLSDPKQSQDRIDLFSWWQLIQRGQKKSCSD